MSAVFTETGQFQLSRGVALLTKMWLSGSESLEIEAY